MLQSFRAPMNARTPRPQAAVRALAGALLALSALASAHPASAAGPAPPSAESAPDFGGYQSLLDQYCRVLPVKGKAADTRFDYEQLYVDEGIWRSKRSARLAAIHRDLFAVDPSRLDDRDRLAWAINAYNFLVLERATLHLLVPLRKFLRYKSVREIVTSDGGFFDAPVADVGARKFSLDQFERAFVYGDSARDPAGDAADQRATPADPRIGFALCRGALGSPPLQPRVFRGATLEQQLDDATRMALALPSFVREQPGGKGLEVSEFFFQQRVDFGGSAAGAVPLLERHAPSNIRALVRRNRITSLPSLFQYNWRLNQSDRAKAKDGEKNHATPFDSTSS